MRRSRFPSGMKKKKKGRSGFPSGMKKRRRKAEADSLRE
jgi:hypothetical protein